MIKFKPYKIIISGNRRDDLVYQLYRDELEVKRIADKTYGTAATKYESKYPYPVGPSIEELNKLERKPGFGPEAEAYETHVEKALKVVVKFQVGQVVLNETKALPEDLYILPVGLRDRVMLPGSEFTPCDDDLDSISATGVEKVPAVKYSPRDPKSCKPTKLFLPETTLLHEIVHGVRPNKIDLLNVSTGDQWDNLEEFFAVVVENIFRSERKQNDLLRGGHDSSVLAENLSTSEGFLSNKTLRARIEIVCKREKLAQKLSRLSGIRFNPFEIVGGAAKH